MTDSKFPTLLNKRARILLDLNRRDLIILGGFYVGLSIFKVSGIKVLLLEVLLLVGLKTLERKTKRGFFEQMSNKSTFTFKFGDLNEKRISDNKD